MIFRTSTALLTLCFLFGCTTTGSSEGSLRSRIKSYQSQIIDDEVTGSNLVIVGAADGTRAMSVVNSGRPGDRDVDETTVFPIWSMSKPVTTRVGKTALPTQIQSSIPFLLGTTVHIQTKHDSMTCRITARQLLRSLWRSNLDLTLCTV